MKLKCVAIDDEPLALTLIENYIKQTAFLEFAGGFNSAVESLSVIQKDKIDIVFLDIQMPGLNGMEFAKSLGKETKIVFITAFDQYAIDGYKVGAYDYLLKPVSYKDFYNTVSKLFAEKENQPVISADTSEEFLFVKAEGKFMKLRFADISYIEGVKDYVNIHFKDQTKMPLLSLNRMKNMEAILPPSFYTTLFRSLCNLLPPSFFRIHKSFIVNMEAIDYIERSHVVIGRDRIPMGNKYVDMKALSAEKVLSPDKLLNCLKQE